MQTAEEIAARLGICTSTANQWRKRGLLRAHAYNNKKQEPFSPDSLTLEALRRYFALREILNEDDLALVQLVQQRRNAIHAFRDRPIGDDTEFQQSVRGYLQMLRIVIARLPYPGDEYVPVE